MASASQCSKYPPFPDDVPAANISKISLAKLNAGSDIEQRRLFDSCRTVGFFLLDLTDDSHGQKLVKDIDGLLQIAKEVMHLDIEEKMKFRYDPPQRLFGYKEEGGTKTDKGDPDRCEFFMFSRDELTGTASPPADGYPAPVRENRSVLDSYVANAQPVISLICRVLSLSFKLPQEALGAMQQPDAQSGTMIRFVRYPASHTAADKRTALLPHTDIGTVTLLASPLAGLQILPPGLEDIDCNWRYVRPEPNCLLVNMGDTMVEWTGGVLRSNMHRVSYSPGEQGNFDRYSIAYLCRAAQAAPMKRLAGGLIPEPTEGQEENDASAREWEQIKTLALIDGKDCAKSTGGRPMREFQEDTRSIAV